MRNFFYFFLLIILSKLSYGQSNNITSIYDGPFEDVLKEAKRINKPIFLNFTADWCVHCQKMEKEAFSDLNIAQKLNSEVIAYKVNADDLDGKRLSKHFNISEFPSYLIINPSSKVIGKIKGYWKPAQFYSELKKVMASNGNEPIASRQRNGFFKRNKVN